MTTHLPSWHNTDGRSRVVPKGIAGVLNARIDADHVAKCQQRLRKRIDKVMYNGTALTGDFSNEAYKIYQWEPAFIETPSALLGASARFSHSGARNVGATETRVPIFTTFVGAPGATPGELEDRAQFVGIVTYAGRDSGGEGATLMGGGVYTGINPGPEYWSIGDYLMWAVPSKAEVETMRAWTGNRANVLGAGGRVTSIIKPYHYSTADFMDATRVAKAIDQAYEVVAPAGAAAAVATSIYKPRAKLANTMGGEPLDEFSIQGQFAKAVRDIVEAQAELMSIAAHPASAGDDNVMNGINNKNRTLIINMLLISAAKAQGKTFVVAAGSNTIADLEIAATRLDKFAPWQRMVRGLASVKHAVERKIIGKAVYGAPVGKDADVHLRAYAY
jgi:hypothetical protein